MNDKSERRKHPRVLVRAMVDYESQDTFLYDYSENLSQGGLFIQTDNPLKMGDTFELKFSLPDIEKVFQVKCIVRWIVSENKEELLKGMGVEFQNLSNDDRDLIKAYVDKIEKK